MYREGPNGFNVPYGHYKTTPKIITKEELLKVSDLIKDVHFRRCDFREAFKEVEKGDFVYLDPPYAPETKTSFVGYTKDGFGIKDHEDLFNLTILTNLLYLMILIIFYLSTNFDLEWHLSSSANRVIKPITLSLIVIILYNIYLKKLKNN